MGKLSFILADLSPVATANLNINYRKPCKVGQENYAVAFLDKIEKERKIYIKF